MELQRTHKLGQTHQDYLISSNLQSVLKNLEASVKITEGERVFRTLVSGLRNKRTPYHRWAHYREAYTGSLVKEIIRQTELRRDSKFIFDPMCGSGSTLVGSAQVGFDSVGSDVNPYAVDLSCAKVAQHSAKSLVEVREFIRQRPHPESRGNSKLEVCERYFQPNTLESLASIREGIEGVQEASARLLLLTAWLTILEDCSERAKGGNGLITRRSTVRDAWTHFVTRVMTFLSDISAYPLPRGITSKAVRASAFHSSSTVEDFQRETGKQVGAAIFSPPYPNSFDYFETYKIELLAEYYNPEELVKVREEAIRNYRKGYRFQLKTRNQIVAAFCREIESRIPNKEARTGTIDNRSRLVPNLLIGYFEDLERVLSELHSCLTKKSSCYLVVAQSAYLGVIIPTDLILAEIATRRGFEVSGIVSCGRAATAAQQLRDYSYLKHMIRQSILSLRVP